MSSTSLFPLLISSLFFFFVQCVPETSQVFRAHFFTSNASRCIIQVSRISSSSSSLIRPLVHRVVIFNARFILFRSLFSRARKKENFFQRCSDALVSRQKNFDAAIISSQFWINHSTFLSFLSLSLACDYTPPQKVREIERIKTHTHTHTEREREG